MPTATDTDDGARFEPFAEQRELFELLGQETRHHIIQTILGHPHGLPSLSELAYYIPKNDATIRSALEDLEEGDLVTRYVHEPNTKTRDLPATFFGLTPYGVTVLEAFGYLRGIPVLRAIHDHTRKPERIERHEAAPRLPLPEAVAKAIAFDPGEPADLELPEPITADKGSDGEQLPVNDDRLDAVLTELGDLESEADGPLTEDESQADGA